MPRATQRPAATFVCVLWVALGLAGREARAQTAGSAQDASRRGETIAILHVPIQGVTREVEAGLRAALREALQQGGFTVLPDAEVEGMVQRDPQLTSCTSRSCFARAALTLGVQRAVEGEVQRPQRSTYRVRLQLRDLRSGQVVAGPEEERCDICGLEEARQMLGRVGARLCRTAPMLERTTAGPETGTLQVDSQPLGAEVLIDGARQEDRTPAVFLLPVGFHSVELRAPGYRPLRRPVQVAPGRQVALNLELVPIPPRRPWLTALSGVLLAGAVGLGVGSAVLFAYDGRPPYGHPEVIPCEPPQLHCEKRWESTAPAIGTTVAAGALLVGGLVALTFDYLPPRRRIVLTPMRPSLSPPQVPPR